MQIGLGTVQFGLDYGVSNATGQVSLDEAARILMFCQQNDIQLFDTAALYGQSERVLGQIGPLGDKNKIVTKLPPCSDLSSAEIDSVFNQSLVNLKVSHVYGLMLHQGADLLSKRGRDIYNKLQDYKSNGLVSKIGVSVYTPEETWEIINKFEIDLIQLPVNVFDQRFVQSGVLQALKRLNVEVHARSTFLQGLLLMKPEDVPDYFVPFKKHLEAYFNVRGSDPLIPAVQFVKNLQLIDYLIVGVTNQQELAQIVNAFNQECHLDFGPYSSVEDGLILPTNWKF